MAHKWTTSKVFIVTSLFSEAFIDFIKNFFLFLYVCSTLSMSLKIHSVGLFIYLFIYLSAVALFSISSICLACPWYLLKGFMPPYASGLEEDKNKGERNKNAAYPFESNLSYLSVHGEGIFCLIQSQFKQAEKLIREY